MRRALLYPPLPQIVRVANGPDDICGEKISANTQVWISSRVMHRHRRFWDQPTAFLPGRFAGKTAPWTHAHFHLASALAHLGRLDEAHSVVKSGLALNPIYTISRDRAVWTGVSDDSMFLARLELLLDGSAEKRGHRNDRASRAAASQAQTDSNRNKGS